MLPTPKFIATPKRYLTPVPEFRPYDFEERWSYQQDPWYGMLDIARHPHDVIESGKGDCVDYARLASSYLYYHTDRPISLYIAFRWNNPPGHIFATDGERVYSTGSVYEETPEEYGRRTNRAIMFRRTIRGNVGDKIIRL